MATAGPRTEDIAGADEALKALFVEFKRSPGSPVFSELSEALLARGHASEALQIAEHGLQLRPNDPNGRIQRAAALLHLGRPRVAYIELLRALAIEPSHHRGMRLLGRVFVDAGVPERAAKLLSRRRPAPNQRPPSTVQMAPDIGRVPVGPTKPSTPKTWDTEPISRNEAATEIASASAPIPPLLSEEETAQHPPPRFETEKDGGADIPEMFAALTKDLGLTPLVPITTKIEVTQIMRVRRNRERGESLARIEGPIVDQSHPGDMDGGPEEGSWPPGATASAYDVVTSPQFHDLGAPMDHEPLFNEAMPFEIRPVSPMSDLDEGDTVQDDAPALDLLALQSQVKKELEGPLPSGKPLATATKNADAQPAELKPWQSPEHADRPVRRFGGQAGGAQGNAKEVLKGGGDLPYLKRFGRSRDRVAEERPVQVRESQPPEPRPLLLRRRPLDKTAWALALVALFLFSAYAGALIWFSRKELLIWFD